MLIGETGEGVLLSTAVLWESILLSILASNGLEVI